MKKLLLLLFSILISFNSYGKTVCVESSFVQERNGLFYLPNQQEPFTGDNLCEYFNTQYKSKGQIKQGKFDSKWTYWFENGQIKSEANYKDGKLEGKQIEWHENGQIEEESVYENDKLVSQTKYEYYENGQKSSEVNAKDGKKDGKWVEWDENGQIFSEATFKDGECISGDCDHYLWKD